MSALAIRNAAIERTETALVLPDGLPETAWLSIGEELGRNHRASAWHIGDWINYGEDAGYVSAEKYDIAMAATGMKRKNLQNIASITRAFPSSSRDELLTFRHYRAAAALPAGDRDAALAHAAAEGLSAAKLAEETRAHPARKVQPKRRHDAVISTAVAFVKVTERWNPEMCEALTPPEARKQLTILRKLIAAATDVVEAVEYRAATPYQFMGR